MPDARLATRITEETMRRLWIQRAQTGRTIQELVEQALREFLTECEVTQNEMLGA